MNILLITPPFCQLNTPYPATAFLKAWLKEKGHRVRQADTGLEVYLRLFSTCGLDRYVFGDCSPDTRESLRDNDALLRTWQLRDRYRECLPPVLDFLQGRDAALAHILCRPGYLPEGERFLTLDSDPSLPGGDADTNDRARLRATLFLEDLADFHKQVNDPDFGFSRYADHLALSPPSFDPLYDKAKEKDSAVSRIHRAVLEEICGDFRPDLAGFSVPFPGNMLEALRGAAALREICPDAHLTLGGGYVNTELRQLEDIRLAEFFDSVTLDDGEDALEALARGLEEETETRRVRTFLPGREGWIFHDDGSRIRHRERPAPDYADLKLNDYLCLADRENPMHRLWSEGPWIKMMAAHGCYWKRCAFCDTSLDYIGRFDPTTAGRLADQMEQLVRETGKRSFHFVDEAAPPALLKELALELIRRNTAVSWWANIRFEKNFSPALCRLLARSGCIAVSGGLEVASDRMLKLMDKGGSVTQVSRVCAAFREAGIMVHAYLMYGFPGQNARELISSLEVVRQLFSRDLVQSAFWHRFALTAHSPVGLDPGAFGVTVTGPEHRGFARNDLHFRQDSEELDAYGKGLNTALYNYMRGKGLELPLKHWFDFRIPAPDRGAREIGRLLDSPRGLELDGRSRLLWIEPLPEAKGEGLVFRGSDYQEELPLTARETDFTISLLEHSLPGAEPFLIDDFDRLAADWNIDGDDYLSSSVFRELMGYGLLVL
jgi:hypothetical protein